MTERALKREEAAQSQMDQNVRSAAGPGDPAEQIFSIAIVLFD
jgi:hypothetical protein